MRSVIQRGFWALCLGLIVSGNTFVAPRASAAIPNIPPAMLAQLKNMSPAEQAALARQYGFELPGAGAFGDGEPSPIGLPGEELTLRTTEKFPALVRHPLPCASRSQLARST